MGREETREETACSLVVAADIFVASSVEDSLRQLLVVLRKNKSTKLVEFHTGFTGKVRTGICPLPTPLVLEMIVALPVCLQYCMSRAALGALTPTFWMYIPPCILRQHTRLCNLLSLF